MEEACERLRREIADLKDQNKNLEKLYIANSIARASTRGQKGHDLSGLISDAIENAENDMTLSNHEYGASKTTQLMAKTMRWKINECMSEIISRSPKETIKEWKAHWEHKDDSDLNFHVKMTVVDQDQETKITQLSFQFDEKNFPAAEVKPLAGYSARILDPSLFFKQIEDFWQKHTNRIRIFQEVNLDAQLNRQTGAYRIIFKSKNQALARLQWLISFNDLATEFLETYEVAFTDEGGKLAQECNFPEDIFIKGMYDQWDVKECIKNLQQLVQMHE